MIRKQKIRSKSVPKTGRPARPKARSAGRGAPERDFTFRIDLIGSRPPIWRRIRVPDDLTLGDLHSVIQAAFGWDDSHLHVFTVQDTTFGPVSPFDESLDDEVEDNWLLNELLKSTGQKFQYEYD